MHRQSQAMHASPGHKMKAGTMPQSAQKHGDEEVDVLSDFAFAVSTQRNIDVIANPSGKRDVPTTPKIGDANGRIRSVEVEWEVETQEKGDADGHVGVAGEITIDLQGIAIEAEKVLQSAVKLGIIKDTINEVQTDIIADDGLFEQSDEDEIHAAGKHLVGDRERTAYLWGKVGGSYNRAGYELGKEGDIESIVEDAG